MGRAALPRSSSHIFVKQASSVPMAFVPILLLAGLLATNVEGNLLCYPTCCHSNIYGHFCCHSFAPYYRGGGICTNRHFLTASTGGTYLAAGPNVTLEAQKEAADKDMHEDVKQLPDATQALLGSMATSESESASGWTQQSITHGEFILFFAAFATGVAMVSYFMKRGDKSNPLLG